MLLNRVEKALMNNPLRAAVQRHLETRWLLEMGGRREGAHALEVGCGRGVGTQLILEHFGVAKVDAFDLDPHMVALARRRLAPYGDRVRLSTGDVERIEAPAGRYDAVFDFGIIHHVPDWPAAVAEIARVLRPGGRFYAEEVFRAFIVNPVVRRLLDHPLKNRFDHEEFKQVLASNGLQLVAERQLWHGFGWYVADKPRA